MKCHKALPAGKYQLPALSTLNKSVFFNKGGENMDFVTIEISDGIATVALNRGKVNALNKTVIGELKHAFDLLENDRAVKAVILTADGNFFSFGFDIPEFRAFSKEQFTDYLNCFTTFYTRLFLYPKPVVAALNGHTVAGGCMIALACDYRVMVTGNAKISLNEIAFGSSVFAGSTEMLRFWCGNANATDILYSGKMFSADEALKLGLIHETATEPELMSHARYQAGVMGEKYQPAFAAIKGLLRKSTGENMAAGEAASIKEFVDIWYSETTWENIKKINIR